MVLMNRKKFTVILFVLIFIQVCGVTLNATFSYAAQDTKDSSHLDKLSDPPTSSSWLSDLKPTKAENGWGPVELDMSNGESGEGDGSTLTLNGVTYDKGLGVHAPSKVSYQLDGNASRFISDIGVDDEISADNSQTYGTVEFQVLADGEVVYESGVMNPDSDTKHIDLDIKGVNLLELVVTDGGDRTSGDHADWAHARITVGDGSGTVPEIELQGDDPLTMNMGEDYVDPGVKAYDGDLTDQIVVQHNIDTSIPRPYEVTYSVTNSSGFTATVKRKVLVVDPTANEGLEMAFPIISDFQLTVGNSGSAGPKITNALQDLYSINPNSDAMVVLGDMVNDGRTESYDKVGEYMNAIPHPDNLFYTIGNHEFFKDDGNAPSISRFLDFTGEDSVYYEKVVNGYPFIVLGSESWGPVGSPTKDSADLSEEQLQWLEQTLKKYEDSSKPIFVYLHNPFPNSFFGTDTEYYSRGILQDKELKGILSQYPQVISFSGHTHHDLRIPGLFVKDNFYMASSGSVYNTYKLDENGNEVSIDHNGSQGLYVQVYDDKVVIKGRDFVKKEWIEEYHHEIPIEDNTPTVKNANDIKTLVEKYEADGEFTDDKAAHALKLHLTAVSRYEDKEQAEKVVKHLEGFNTLLEHQEEKEMISEKAHEVLQLSTETLIEKWQ